MASPHVAGWSRSCSSYGIADANGNGLLADDVKAHLCATAATASYPAQRPIPLPELVRLRDRGRRQRAAQRSAARRRSREPPRRSPRPTAPRSTEDGGPTRSMSSPTTTTPTATLVVGTVSIRRRARRRSERRDGGRPTPRTPTRTGPTPSLQPCPTGTAASAATVTVTIRPSTTDPVATDDGAGVPAGGSVTIDVLANDSDIDGDALTVTAVGAATNGTATVERAAAP